MIQLLAFDLDKTLLQYNISFRFGKYLYKEGKISFLSTFSILIYWILYLFGIISTYRLHKALFTSIFYGKKKSEIEESFSSMLSLKREERALISHIRTSLREEIVQRRAQLQVGERLEIAILSSSPDFLVEPFALALQADWWRASSYKVDAQGVFTSVAMVMTGRLKDISLQLWKKEKQGNSLFIHAYSDSLRDFAMLKMASRAICVAPSFFLRIVALFKRWQIVEK